MRAHLSPNGRRVNMTITLDEMRDALLDGFDEELPEQVDDDWHVQVEYVPRHRVYRVEWWLPKREEQA